MTQNKTQGQIKIITTRQCEKKKQINGKAIVSIGAGKGRWWHKIWIPNHLARVPWFTWQAFFALVTSVRWGHNNKQILEWSWESLNEMIDMCTSTAQYVVHIRWSLNASMCVCLHRYTYIYVCTYTHAISSICYNISTYCGSHPGSGPWEEAESADPTWLWCCPPRSYGMSWSPHIYIVHYHLHSTCPPTFSHVIPASPRSARSHSL